ncbi:MAG: hypothetical protein R2939_00705 [Kofleriaceae bacterium]
MATWVVAAGALAGCYAPAPAEGLACASGEACPDGQRCDVAAGVCVRVGVDAAARVDAAAEVDAFPDAAVGEFGALTLLEDVTVGEDESPTMSADGLVLVFSSTRVGAVGGAALFLSERASRTSPWSIPARIVELDSAQYEACPELTSDGAALYFVNQSVLRFSERGEDGTWSAPIDAPDELQGGQYNCAAFSGDQRRALVGQLAVGRITQSLLTREDVAEPWGFVGALFLTDLHSIQTPWLDADGGTVVLDGRPGALDDDDLYVATQTAAGEYGPPVRWDALSLDGVNDRSPTFTADLRDVILERDGFLYEATR